MAATAYIGLGSNLENPVQQLRQAVCTLKNLRQTEMIKVSQLYQSKPIGPSNQPDFVNAVIAVKTTLSSVELLVELLLVEKSHGRVRDEHWGPRVLDLDLLLYDDEVMTTEFLTLPHPGIKQRVFVLYPLDEIAPDLKLPNGEMVSELLALFSKKELTCLGNIGE